MGRDKIRSLTVREQARDRLPVWYGSRDNYLHGLREVLANASDEISNNYGSGEIYVELEDDMQTISVLDTGRGIPIKGKTDGVDNYKLLFLTLFSGTNYDNVENDKVTIGVNGLGVSILNFNSELFDVRSFKDNKQSRIIFKNGGEVTYTEWDIPHDFEHGTMITFKLDKETFTNTYYKKEEIVDILKALAGANNKLTIKFEHKGIEELYHYETPEDYLVESSSITTEKSFSFGEAEFTDKGERNVISCAWNISTEPFQNTFLNYTNLTEHGTIYDGFINGMRRVFNKDNKIKFTAQDIEMSFGMVVSVLSNNAEFTNQTKFSTAKQLYRKLTSDYIVSNMEIFKAENPQEFDKILKHLQQINVFNTKNEKSIKNIKKKLSEKATSATSRPLKLIPCRSKNPKEVELILIEGDSAMTSVKASRNPNTMMILPLKGKPINALKQSLERLLGNQEILDIFKILECGVTYKGKNVKGFDKFDIDKLAVNKVLIATDFDDDGFHIQALLIGVFYILAPQLLTRGIVEFIQTPLYLIKTKDQTFKAYSENERQRIISGLSCKYSEVRFKGIGGLPVKVMKEALSMDTRISYKVTMNDAKKCADKIELFLSDNVEARKKYIEENGDKFVNETLFI